MRLRLITSICAAALVAGGGLSACGSSSSEQAATASTALSEPATPTTETTTAAAQAQVSANSASEDEITAALEAAGVENADRWAREVLEYRPYDEGDATLGQLRQELTKYNPSADQLERILGALRP